MILEQSDLNLKRKIKGLYQAERGRKEGVQGYEGHKKGFWWWICLYFDYGDDLFNYTCVEVYQVVL